MIKAGATPRPWPTVDVVPVPTYLTILNPAVVLALTVEVIEPLVLDDVVGLANHDHPT